MNDYLWGEKLKAWQDAETPVNIFLSSGVKLTGVIYTFDDHGLLFPDSNGVMQLINRAGVATIQPREDWQ